MNNLASWYEPIYRQNFWLIVGATNEQVCAWAKRELNIDLQKDEKLCFGTMLAFCKEKDGLNGCAIWFPKWTLTEYRIFERIPKSMVWYVGTRELIPHKTIRKSI